MNRIIILFLVIVMTTNTAFSQSLLDTTDLIFKAKLLTLNREGIGKRDSVLSSLAKQKSNFLLSPTQNLYFIQITFDQSSSNGAEWLGHCNYYLAFNLSKNKYYRLGGFDSLDIGDFFEDLEGDDFKIFDFAYQEKSSIDFYCLSTFNDWSGRKKRKRKFTCFDKCSDVLYKYFSVSKGKD